MINMKKLRAILFALPGFGNPVLASLIQEERVDVQAVFTVKYESPFPYYDEVQLDVACKEYSVPCHYGMKVSSSKGLDLIRSYSPDLILVATFKQILKQKVLNIPTFGVVNFHPSLLPYYRGPCPTNAALLHGEKVTGMTIHYVTEGIDDGDILLQRSVEIEKDEIDGQLRQKLAQLSGDMVPELIALFSKFHKPSGKSQDHEKATFAPKPNIEDGYIEASSDIETIQRQLRAYNPIPGTTMLIDGVRIPVDHFDRLPNRQGDGVFVSENYIDVIINSEAIRLYKKEACL
jgi:methionyl-tRNA formyltransferase